MPKIAPPVVIPSQTIIMLSGIPATGKSTFARYLAREHGFAHYDLERNPRGWPHPELKETWDSSQTAFLAQVRQCHDWVVLDWGFPVSCLALVDELRAEGVRLIWFDGDISRARQKFLERGSCKGPVEGFDRQVAAIHKAGYPALLNCVVIPALAASGEFLELSEIAAIIFAGSEPN
jgi:hypothetical protein